MYARGAADDKAPIIAMMTALDAIRAAGISRSRTSSLRSKAKKRPDSANLEKTLAANKELFAADLWLMCDGPLHQTRRQSIVFGARGVTPVDVTVYGPRGELHSGHYGNWAPNPALLLARLLASMKDENGQVLVDHFYDQVEPLSPIEKRAIAEAPDDRRRPHARVLAGFDRGRRQETHRADYSAVAQHPRHGQLAHRRAGVERDSRDRQRHHGRSPSEGHGPAHDRRSD